MHYVDLRRVQWQERANFSTMAARTMGWVLVDFAWAQKALTSHEA